MIGHRKSDGSAIFLVSLIIGILLFVVLCGMGFNYLLLTKAQAQYRADSLALMLATKINAFDRVADVNELQEGSRELIFTSRETASQCADVSKPELNALCDRLIDDARSGHLMVEGERQNQILKSTMEIQDAALAYNRQRKKDNTFAFLGLQTFAPEILRVDVGRIARVDCNVRSVSAIPELARFDTYKSYFDRKSKLYKCDLDAKLPDQDSDLSFNFSSLPPSVGKTGAAPRNTNENVFVPYATIFADGKCKDNLPKQIPSAVQVVFTMDSVLPWDHSTRVPINLIATGSTGGASPDSRQ